MYLEAMDETKLIEQLVMGFIIGGALQPLQSIFPLFIVLYGIFNAFGEMGPGEQRSPNEHPSVDREHLIMTFLWSNSFSRCRYILDGCGVM
jgi:hypothetical protein